MGFRFSIPDIGQWLRSRASSRGKARMIRRAVGIVAMLGLTACSFFDETPAYRYRLTVEVETPEGLRTGSSVIEVDTGISRLPTIGGVAHSVRGEAVTVDLGGGQFLFALLRSPGNIDWASNIMFLLAPPAPKSAEDTFLTTFENMLAMQNPIELPGYYNGIGSKETSTGIPMLVTFSDLSEPKSVEQVDPEDLAATFGDGTSLRRITVQMTDAAVTTGIENQLEWLPETSGTMLDGQWLNTLDTEFRLANDLSQGDFSKEVLK